MKHLLNCCLLFLALLFGAGCSVSPKYPVQHDFGFPVSIANATITSKPTNEPMVTVNAPTWLWDNRIRYRLLYASPTQIGFYALDLWIASPPELLEQLLLSGGKTKGYSLIIRLHDFEQQFDAPDRAKVVLHFFAEAYANDNKKKMGTQEFYFEQPTVTADAAGAVNGFVNVTRQATDKIQIWLAGLPGK
ncbi:hypothetical protein [Methylobacter psychrophilus]|uniref:hypothetical protein n=1 Tax=Methylobacter psychrophilus TaxID=96941 RepID=UPI0021D4EE98|nr:hypothetical protein [Methylobacter psychrophilus]